MASSLSQFLMDELRIGERELARFVASAPERYKVYKIKKRTGGFREIAQPAIELKIAQRAIMRRYLQELPVHDCATAYKSGASILKNVSRHAEVNGPILKYDFKDFFPSITEMAWLAYCRDREIFDRDDAILAARILFRRAAGQRTLRLSIGAPSSPLLSNILLYDFDSIVYEKVRKHKVAYTRYADDMTFSAQRTGNLSDVDKIIKLALRTVKYPRLTINKSKTVTATRKFRRQVTGLIITTEGSISIGRDRKRIIRSAIHHYILGKLSDSQQAWLAGNLAFAKDIEPIFYERMKLRYGSDALARLKSDARGYRRPVHRKTR